MLKVLLDFSYYATKKELEDATGADTTNLADKNDFTVSIAEVDKLDINKLVNVSTSLNNLKSKMHDLDVEKLKSVPVDLKKTSDVVSKEVVKNTKFNKLNKKLDNLEHKILDASTLIQKKPIGDVDKKIPGSIFDYETKTSKFSNK